MVGAELRPHAASLERRFAAKLANMRLTPVQRRTAPALTLGAAVRAINEGHSASRFLDRAAEAARTMLMLDTQPDQIVSAVCAFDELATLVFRSLPRERRSEVALAREALHRALLLRLTETIEEIRAREAEFLESLLDIELRAATPADLLGPVLDRVVHHFGAEAGVVYEEAVPGSAVLRAATGGGSLEEVALRKNAKKLLGTIKTARPGWPGILDQSWGNRWHSVWSIPIDPGSRCLTAQIGFSDGRALLVRERRVLELAAARCRIAVERIAREEKLRQLSVRTLEIEEMERRRIARELHDDAGQLLVCARLQIELAETTLTAGSEETREQLAGAREMLEKTIVDVRRLISELSPVVLDQLGPEAALRQLVTRFRRSYGGRVRFHIGKLPAMGTQFALVVYRSLQECFTNISQHSFASNINVSVTTADRVLRLHVEDDGVGFRVDEGLGRKNCYGLIGIRERVSLLGGRFSVRSTPEGGEKKSPGQVGGTKVTIELPLREEKP
jgi:signal transduction histidine kinase